MISLIAILGVVLLGAFNPTNIHAYSHSLTINAPVPSIARELVSSGQYTDISKYQLREEQTMFSFHHVSLSVSDIDKSIQFYSALGYKKVLMWNSDNNNLTIAHLKMGGSLLELFCYASPNPPPESTRSLDTDLPRIGIKHFGLRTYDLQEAKQKLEYLGFADNIKMTHGRTGIDYFFIKDPDGIFIEVVQDERDFN